MSCPAVLLIIFNRPDKTQVVFDAIARAKPKVLYVAADGPRRPEEAARCEATRAIVERVDWDCEVKTLFHARNLGCRRAVVAALDWFFASEPYGIILEDDCEPAGSFFPYCEELLLKYEHDESVGVIAGTSYADPAQVPDSYYFSDYAAIWGWASWARVWKHYDADIRAWHTLKPTNFLRTISHGEVGFSAHWTYVFDSLFGKNPVDTWDYQLFFMVFLYRFKTIMPKVNLIRNIGAGADATHHTEFHTIFHERATGELPFPLKHPPNKDIDQRLIKNYLRVYDYKRFLARKIIKSLVPSPVLKGWRAIKSRGRSTAP